MAIFVIVHGAWTGGWAWRAVARELQAAGHEAFTPTLTGLGERVHLGGSLVDLDTHIQDIVNVLRYEQLEDVILIGHSYGGMVVTGAADREPERIGRLVYLDAYLPHDGESCADFAGGAIRATVLLAAAVFGDGWRIPLPNPSDAARSTAMPLRAGQQCLSLRQPDQSGLPRTYVRFTSKPPESVTTPIMDRMARRARDEIADYREAAFDHSPHLAHPREVAALLLGIAAPGADGPAVNPGTGRREVGATDSAAG